MSIKSLVTGGAGFIGSYVAKELLEMGHQVIVLDDLSGGTTENIPEGAHFHEGSILDVDLIEALFQEHQFDYVYHLAAYAAEGLSHFIRRYNYQNNLIGSVNLINAAVNYKVQCFVFTSSIAVYGKNDLPHHEGQIPAPEDPYGIAKYAVEMDLRSAHELFGLNSIIFRPHNVYGSVQNIGDKYRNVIGIFINQILEEKPLTIFGDGQQSRAFTHISDVAPYIAHSINHPKAINQVFDIGADETYTVNQIADEVIKAMNQPTQKKYESARKEMVHAYSNHTKFRSYFNAKSPMKLKDGLEEMANFVMKSGPKSTTEFQAIEIEKNLPESWKKRP